MPRPPQPQPAWKLRWYRVRRPLIALMLVAAIPLGIFVSFGLTAALFFVALGLATFAGGPPAHNGPVSPPSVPPSQGFGV